MSHPFKVVIPARYASSRFPGKPLVDILGKPMIHHVYERAQESGADEIVIATDDDRIRAAAEAFGAEVCMTSSEHPSGTDRIAEVNEKMAWADDTIIVNVQGDEPLLDPELIRQVAMDMDTHEDAGIATIGTHIQTAEELHDPHVVKIAMDNHGYALYFSRAAIPWDRDHFNETTGTLPANSRHYRHIGLYAYRASFLSHYSSLEPCYIEQTESLEQLRALANGVKIHVSITASPPGHGVDTEKDLEKVIAAMGVKTPG